MSIEVHVPQLPESVADGTLVTWYKQPGDAVARDENLVDLETDKVVLEVPSPVAGVLKEIKFGNGSTVTSGQLIALIDAGAGATHAAAAARPAGATKSDGAPRAEGSAAKLSPAAKRVVEES